MRKTLEFVQIMSCVESFCIFVKIFNDASCEFLCLVEMEIVELLVLCFSSLVLLRKSGFFLY